MVRAFAERQYLSPSCDGLLPSSHNLSVAHLPTYLLTTLESQ